MKKASTKDDEMRAGYTRADLGPLVRGKYAAQGPRRVAQTSCGSVSHRTPM